MFEIFSVAVAYAKLGQVSKLGFINRLKARPFFQEGKVGQAVSRLAGFLDDLATTKMCFVAGTKIHAADGLKNIEEVQIGDKVLSRDPVSMALAYRNVTRTFVTRPVNLYHILYRPREGSSRNTHCRRSSTLLDEEDDGESDIGPSELLVATGEHPFYVVEKGTFVPADKLAYGDMLLLKDGNTAEVISVQIEGTKGEPFKTYNIEVADYHTYLVGEAGVWVHNAAGRECAQIRSIYLRLKNRGKTPNEIFRTLEKRLKLAEKSAKQRRRVLAEAIEEALEKDVFPGRSNFWTKGQWGSAGENIWHHFFKHVRKQKEFGNIDDVVTYVQEARKFVEHPPPGVLTKTRISRNKAGEAYLDLDGNPILEKVFMDLRLNNQGEFAVQILTGPEAGAVKTYFFVGDDALKYFKVQ
jgi:hypothetical protein